MEIGTKFKFRNHRETLTEAIFIEDLGDKVEAIICKDEMITALGNKVEVDKSLII